MKKLSLFLILFSLILNINLFAKVKIATSIYPIATILKEIVTSDFEIVYIIPPNANPHIYEPTPKKIIKLKTAQIFIGIHKHFDGWIEKFLPEECRILYLLKEKKDINPHIWLSPSIMINKINEILYFLCTNSPCYYNPVQKKTNKFKRKINKFLKINRAKLAKIKNKNFIQYHPAWDYFAKDFGLNIVGTLKKGHSRRISLRKIDYLLKIVKKYNVKYFLVGINEFNNIIFQFAKEANLKIIRLDAIGHEKMGYLDILEFNIKQILKSVKN